MATGLKHLITCRCVLPQLKRLSDPPLHMFTVFSVIEDDGGFRVRFAQCNNCGIIHKVTEINRSIVVPKESMGSLVTVNDIRGSLPVGLANVLDANDADLATWEMASFIVENKQWGSFVVLASDEEAGTRQGKYVRILGETLFKVESFVREEEVTR